MKKKEEKEKKQKTSSFGIPTRENVSVLLCNEMCCVLTTPYRFHHMHKLQSIRVCS